MSEHNRANLNLDTRVYITKSAKTWNVTVYMKYHPDFCQQMRGIPDLETARAQVEHLREMVRMRYQSYLVDAGIINLTSKNIGMQMIDIEKDRIDLGAPRHPWFLQEITEDGIAAKFTTPKYPNIVIRYSGGDDGGGFIRYRVFDGEHPEYGFRYPQQAAKFVNNTLIPRIRNEARKRVEKRYNG